MNLFNPYHVNAAWTFLTAGSPSLLTMFAVANAAFILLFMYYRGKKAKADYPKIRSQLQMLMGITNIAILFSDGFMGTIHNALQPFQGLLNLI